MDDDIVGLGFRPTEDELVDFYLKHMLLGDDPRAHVIPVIDLCDVEPWDVPVMLAKSSSAIRFGDPDWFFFSPVDFKYSKSKRFNRTTKCGFWKPTGKDREVRAFETNTLIGTKKTLVFYEGRVSRGVKSIWVIHEYHAVTFHESERTFVLCRLMKKPGKTTEGGTDALICDEGEPSRHIISVYGNQETAGVPSGSTFTGMETILQATPQAEKYFSPTSIQQCQTGIEEEASFPSYPFNNAYFRNENSLMQTSFETIEEGQTSFKTIDEGQTSFEITEEVEFLNSILVDESFVIDKESMHAFVNSFTQSESLSDTNAEVVSKLDGYTVDISTVCQEYPNSDEYHSSKRLKSSHDVVHGGIYFPSPNPEAKQETKESMFRDDFWGVETSSCESTAHKPLEISCIEISSSPSTSWRWEN